MNNIRIDKLIVRLMNAKYKDNQYEFPIVSKTNGAIVENIIREWGEEYIQKTNSYIGQLEAKVLTYEAIIKNSNFAPLIKDEENTESEVD